MSEEKKINKEACPHGCGEYQRLDVHMRNKHSDRVEEPAPKPDKEKEEEKEGESDIKNMAAPRMKGLFLALSGIVLILAIMGKMKKRTQESERSQLRENGRIPR
jgi:hypothetical protein